MLYARKINRRINSGIYLGPTQGLSSPKNNRRACLCTKTDTYSRECCNGDLIAQGIGSIQGTTTAAPISTTTTAGPTTTSTSTSTSTSTTTRALYTFQVGDGTGSGTNACNNAIAGTFVTAYANSPTLGIGVNVYRDAAGTIPWGYGKALTQGAGFPKWSIFNAAAPATIDQNFGTCTAPLTTTTSTTSTSTSTTSTSTSTTSTTSTSTTSTTTAAPTSTTTTTAAPLPIVTGSLTLWTSYGLRSGSTSWPDRSGNGNTALISGSTLAISGSGVGQDFGLKFNGTNNFLTYPAPLNTDPTTDWTIQFYGTWDITSSNLDYFTHFDYTDGWDIALTPDGRMSVRVNPLGGVDFNWTLPKATLGLVTVTFDYTNAETKLYYNTTLIQTKAVGIFNWNETNVPLTFGWNANTDATYFAGTVRELTLYNKVLTSGEITTNYNVFITQP